MTINTKQVMKEALELPLSERIHLTDKLLLSINNPNEEIDKVWQKEIEDRIAAYKTNKTESIPIEKVMERYSK